MNTRSNSLAVLLALSAAQGATALEYTVSIGYTGDHSDNIFRREAVEVSDTVHRAFASVNVNLGRKLVRNWKDKGKQGERPGG